MKGTGEMESNTAQASISGVMVGKNKGFGRMVIKYRKSRGMTVRRVGHEIGM